MREVVKPPARPGPIPRCGDQSPRDRVVMHVTQFLQALFLCEDIEGIESALPDAILSATVDRTGQAKTCEPWSSARVVRIPVEESQDAERRTLLQLLNDAAGGVGCRGTDQQVEVVGHKHPTQELETELASYFIERRNEHSAETRSLEQRRAPISAGSDKLDLPGSEISRAVRHG